MVFPGVPHEITLRLAKIASISTFVETGTYRGSTTRWAAKHFNNVYTIENSEFHFAAESESLSHINGVKPIFGNSRDLLPSIIDELGQSTAIFFLDGHWSGHETAGHGDECPLLGELESLRGREGDIILIDDARFFHCPPLEPHNPSDWPTIGEIVIALQKCQSNPYIAIVDDVIFSVPNSQALIDCFIDYSRGRSRTFWRDYNKGISLRNHILDILSPISRTIKKALNI